MGLLLSLREVTVERYLNTITKSGYNESTG